MIKAIIFDLGGILIDVDMNLAFDNVKALGVNVNMLTKDSGDATSANGSTICEGMSASGMIHKYQIGEISTEDFLGAIMGLSKEGTTRQQVEDAWNACLLTIPEYKLEFIKQLRSEGFATYMLSNTNDAHWKYIKNSKFPEPMDNYFDHCFLSQEMGIAKPDTAIYESVLQQIPFSAEECLFIDDSNVNCQAAEKLGIKSVNIPERTDFREKIRQNLM